MAGCRWTSEDPADAPTVDIMLVEVVMPVTYPCDADLPLGETERASVERPLEPELLPYPRLVTGGRAPAVEE